MPFYGHHMLETWTLQGDSGSTAQAVAVFERSCWSSAREGCSGPVLLDLTPTVSQTLLLKFCWSGKTLVHTQARGSSYNPHRFFNNWETELEFDICEGLQGEIFQVYVLLCPVVVWCPSQKYKTLLSPEILLMNIWELFLVGSLFPLRFLFLKKKNHKKASYSENKVNILHVVLTRSSVNSQCFCMYSVLKRNLTLCIWMYNFLPGNLSVFKLQLPYRWFQCNSAQPQVSEWESWIPLNNRDCSPAQAKAVY